jgi:hypothetical protein
LPVASESTIPSLATVGIVPLVHDGDATGKETPKAEMPTLVNTSGRGGMAQVSGS